MQFEIWTELVLQIIYDLLQNLLMSSSDNGGTIIKLVDETCVLFHSFEALAKQGVYQDVLLVCADKKFTGSMLLLALAVPNMFNLLKNFEEGEELLTLLLPQFKASDITKQVNNFLWGHSQVENRIEREGTLIHTESPLLAGVEKDNDVPEDDLEGHHEEEELTRPAQSDMEMQNREHENCENVVCPLCYKCPDRSLNLQSHLMEFHNYVSKPDSALHKRECEIRRNLWRCQQNNCTKKFGSEKLLLVHQKRHRGEFRFSCEMCKEKFVTRAAFQIHMKIHQKDFNFKCNQCSKQHVTHRGYLRHMKTHVPKKLSCNCCGKKFCDEIKLKEHIEEEWTRKAKLNQCRHCLKIFSTKKNLKVHVMNIHEKIRHFCDQCGSSFSVKQNLLNHIHEKHKESVQKKRPQHACKECGRIFGRAYNLCKNHQFRDKTQLLTCDRCGFSTKRSQQLLLHQVSTQTIINT